MTLGRRHNELLIVTGMSGAGRSTVANALEDLGWYVVDNLPPQMLTPLATLAGAAESKLPSVAVVVDIRSEKAFEQLERELLDFREHFPHTRILFLEATDQALVRRFEQVRRPHPLQQDGTIVDGIDDERSRLQGLRNAADIVIDTSDLNVHQLTTQIIETFSDPTAARLSVTLMSFGFKYGTPIDADMIADMRFLPNPYWVPELKTLTGKDAPVRDYVLQQPGASEFLAAYERVLLIVLNGYLKEDKHHATFAIGCTGGKHRSVAITEELAHRLAQVSSVAVQVKHRDFGKE